MDIAPARNLDPPAQPIDEEMQEMLGDMAREEEPEPEVGSEGPMFPNLWRDLVELALLSFCLTVALLYVVKLWRRLIPLVEERRHKPRVGYRLALDLLAEVGYLRERGETREQFAERLREIVPSLTQLTAWHVASRFADPAGPLERRTEFRVESWDLVLRVFKKQLREKVPWYRRAIGALNPFSFFFVR